LNARKVKYDMDDASTGRVMVKYPTINKPLYQPFELVDLKFRTNFFSYGVATDFNSIKLNKTFTRTCLDYSKDLGKHNYT